MFASVLFAGKAKEEARRRAAMREQILKMSGNQSQDATTPDDAPKAPEKPKKPKYEHKKKKKGSDKLA